MKWPLSQTLIWLHFISFSAWFQLYSPNQPFSLSGRVVVLAHSGLFKCTCWSGRSVYISIKPFFPSLYSCQWGGGKPPPSSGPLCTWVHQSWPFSGYYHAVCSRGRYVVVLWLNIHVKASKGGLFVWKLSRLKVPECTLHSCHTLHWHHWRQRDSDGPTQHWGDPGWWAASSWWAWRHGEDCDQVKRYTETTHIRNTKYKLLTSFYISNVNVSSKLHLHWRCVYVCVRYVFTDRQNNYLNFKANKELILSIIEDC